MAGNPALIVRVALTIEELKKNLAEGVSQIETTTAAMGKLAASFSGDKLVQQAMNVVAAVNQIGGASKLTEAEQARVNSTLERALEKYAVLGKEAPAGMQALADATKQTANSWGEFVAHFNIKEAIEHPLETAKEAMAAFAETLGPAGIAAVAAAGAITAVGAAVFELAVKAAEVGGHLNDMSEKTGMSVPALSRLSLAAQVAGSDLGTMTNALFMFEKNLGEDTPKFAKGLDRIGLSIADVKAAGVDNYLTLVAHAMKETEDPSERAAAAVELFNRQGRDIIPTLLKLDDALKATNDIRPWTDQQAKDAEHFEMQLTSLKVHAEAFAIALGQPLIGPLSTFGAAVVSVGGFLSHFVDFSGGVLSMLETGATAWKWGAAAVDTYKGSVGDLPPVAADASLGVKRLHEAVKAYTESGQAAALTTNDERRAIEEITEARKKDEAAAKQAAEAYKKLMEEISKIEGDHKTQFLTGLLDMSAAEQQGTQKRLENESKGSDQIKKAEAELRDFEMKASMDSATYQIMKIWEHAEEQKKAYDGLEILRGHYNDVIDTKAAEEADAIAASMKRASDAVVTTVVTSAGAIITLIDGVGPALDSMAHKADETLEHVKQQAAAATQYSMVGGRKLSQSELDEYYKTAAGQEEIARNRGKRYYEGEILPRAMGGGVAADRPYVVGERGPELFVPERSGTIVPTGGSSASGPTIIIHAINVTQPLGTPDAIGKAIEARMRSLGMRLS